MRNYIILNNQRSDEISGLIIQELAPISKPLQRTQVETIDGRDGDIVTPLGYAAYDKKITIGLYGDFDINEIIAYFATQGTAIFSNEPDKYYNYQILDQIDYERLVRFRVATVTMHVQPFKYSATEGTLTIDASDTVSGEGSEIALDNTAEAPFTTLRHKGNATQDGTPTPDNPIEIKVLTGDGTIKITGKNLAYDGWAQDFVTRINNAEWANIGQYEGRQSLMFLPRAGYGDYDNKYLFKTNFAENTQYTFSFDEYTTDQFTSLAVAYTDGTTETLYHSSTEYNKWIHVVKTTAQNKTVKYLRTNWQGGAKYIDLSSFMCEKSATATDYEPYKEQSYVIPFGDTYLAGIGDYADEPVKVGDTWYIRRAIGKVVLDGTEWWGGGTSTGSPTMLYSYTSAIDSTGKWDAKVALSNNYTAITTKIVTAYATNEPAMSSFVSIASEQYFLRFMTPLTVASSVANFKTWLSTHPITVYYVLATPTAEAITDQDLIDALDDFYDQAHSYKGHTHITATAADGNAPAILSVEVGEDNESTVTNAGNTTSRPILTIYGQGDIGVYINDVEVLDIALGNEQYITLDSTEMDAYKDSTANLKNRLVTGDYSKLALNAGANKIRFTGNVTKYEISKYSRWL